MNAFQQPPAVLKLLQKLVYLSQQRWISPSVFSGHPGGLKTSFGNEGLTQNLMFTIDVYDFFFCAANFHCGCSGYIRDVTLSMFDHKLFD